MSPTKDQMRRWMENRRRAYRIIDRERRRRLAGMTVKESLAIFEDLYAAHRPLPADEQRELDRRELRSWLKVRRAFQKWGRTDARE